VKLLLDEMYPAALADALLEAGVDATTVTDQSLAGASDAEVFAAAVAGGFVVLTENVGDFTRIAAEHSTAGGHHPGLLIALTSRFSRRRAGIPPLVTAIRALGDQALDDRTVYLERALD
jgi:predicted nuclease of predicted toxin-antitoxin system